MTNDTTGLTRYYIEGELLEDTNEEQWVEAENAVEAAHMASILYALPDHKWHFSRMEWIGTNGALKTMVLTEEQALADLDALMSQRNDQK